MECPLAYFLIRATKDGKVWPSYAALGGGALQGGKASKVFAPLRNRRWLSNRLGHWRVQRKYRFERPCRPCRKTSDSCLDLGAGGAHRARSLSHHLPRLKAAPGRRSGQKPRALDSDFGGRRDPSHQGIRELAPQLLAGFLVLIANRECPAASAQDLTPIGGWRIAASPPWTGPAPKSAAP